MVIWHMLKNFTSTLGLVQVPKSSKLALLNYSLNESNVKKGNGARRARRKLFVALNPAISISVDRIDRFEI